MKRVQDSGLGLEKDKDDALKDNLASDSEKKKPLQSHPHGGHRQRLKDRFLRDGLKGFEQHQMLELLLFYVIPRKDTNLIAHRLIQTFGGLSNVLKASVSQLVKVEGITENVATLLSFSGELIREYYSDSIANVILNDTVKMGEYIRPWFIGEDNERVLLVCLDNKCKVLHCDFVSEGSINATEISLRRILEQAIVNKSSGAVIAHNHPNGFALPSVEDQKTTRQITDTLAVAGIELLDHLVFADDDFVSMRSTPSMKHLFVPSRT